MDQCRACLSILALIIHIVGKRALGSKLKVHTLKGTSLLWEALKGPWLLFEILFAIPRRVLHWILKDLASLLSTYNVAWICCSCNLLIFKVDLLVVLKELIFKRKYLPSVTVFSQNAFRSGVVKTESLTRVLNTDFFNLYHLNQTLPLPTRNEFVLMKFGPGLAARVATFLVWNVPIIIIIIVFIYVLLISIVIGLWLRKKELGRLLRDVEAREVGLREGVLVEKRVSEELWIPLVRWAPVLWVF